MRFQQGVEERPTRLPISATESEASSCSTARILRSIVSMLEYPCELDEAGCKSPVRQKNLSFYPQPPVFREKIFYFKHNSSGRYEPPNVAHGGPPPSGQSAMTRLAVRLLRGFLSIAAAA